MSFIHPYKKQLSQLCNKYKVEHLYVFGSASKNKLTENSDIDLLVKFKKINLAKYFINYMGFKRELQSLFNREVDLLEEQTLSNPYLIDSINRDKELIYG